MTEAYSALTNPTNTQNEDAVLSETPGSSNLGTTDQAAGLLGSPTELPSQQGGDGRGAPASHEGHSSIASVSVNFINSVLGAGLLGVPFVMSLAGLWLSLILLVVMAAVTHYGVMMLVYAGQKHRVNTFPGLMLKVGGPLAKNLTITFMTLFTIGGMISYTVIIGDVLPPVLRVLLPEATHWFLTRTNVQILLTATILFPLSALRDVSQLEKSSALSLIAIVIILASVGYAADNLTDDERPEPPEDAWSFARAQFFPAIGVISHAYVVHHNTFMLYDSLGKATPKRFAITSTFSLGVSALVSIALGLLGYLTFWTDVEGDLLNNFPEENSHVVPARLGFVTLLLFTYPLELHVARRAITAALYKPGHILSTAAHYTITLSLVIPILIVGNAVTDLGYVFELNGSFSACTLAFILPPAASILASGKKWTDRENMGATAMLVFGVVSGISGTALTLVEIYKEYWG